MCEKVSLIIWVLRLGEGEQFCFQFVCFFLVLVELRVRLVLVIFAAHLLILQFLLKHSIYSPF